MLLLVLLVLLLLCGCLASAVWLLLLLCGFRCVAAAPHAIAAGRSS